ncbi:hypothetical protein RchiOBHm_Chr2g0125371 [Rosa chinensis]|uniref:Uncharacterized protein n=1 Tax=Rosa chinensis TaxID=74649 RepID=A0A2P6RTI9_ROSCH|nr:hypothetical protein RchiOBHm_Chr2g0125371 [Rosa chinensis]
MKSQKSTLRGKIMWKSILIGKIMWKNTLMAMKLQMIWIMVKMRMTGLFKYY